MTIQVTPKRVAILLLALLCALGCILVLRARYRHAAGESLSELRTQYLQKAGDAPPDVQQGVRTALHGFQDGYIQRDPRNIDAFMSSLFDKDDDILVLGADRGEWIRGYPAAAQFIRNDWVYWGDFRFAVDDSIICSKGDVAWVESVGTVRIKEVERPMRFSAILDRRGNTWHFRQVHFQWDGGTESLLNRILNR